MKSQKRTGNTGSPASSPGAVVRAKKKKEARGLMGREPVPQLHGHRAQESHNSMGTALKKGATPGDEAAGSLKLMVQCY